MLDIKFIRDNVDLVKDAARKKHIDIDIDALIHADERRRELLQMVEEKRAKQNTFNEKISGAQPGEERDALIAEMRTFKDALQKEETALKETLQEWQQLMVQVPNVPDVSVPEGDSDADNQEVRVHGEKPVFDFTPKSHKELMENLGMADFERGSKVAGFRGYFLTGAGVKLNMALWQFTLDHFFAQQDFTPVMAPSLVKREAFIGTGYLPQSEEDLYKTQDDTFLAGTSEVAVMSYHMDETLDAGELPKKYFAFSPCFRREAGSYGKDTKGLMRVHEFYKYEQVVLCEASHEASVAMHEELTVNAETLMQQLNVPYHVVVNCGGDLGLGQVKKYDIEAWVPSENCYRETHSSSYFHDFQTRRLNIKYRDANGQTRYAHSLNNTAVATPRLLIPIIENNQQADGSILVPKVLQPYLGTDVIQAP